MHIEPVQMYTVLFGGMLEFLLKVDLGYSSNEPALPMLAKDIA